MAAILIARMKSGRVSLGEKLNSAGHSVRFVEDASTVTWAIARCLADITLIDNTERADSAEVTELLAATEGVPTIVLGSPAEESSITDLLHQGADLYLEAPVSFNHLLARIDAVVRRIKYSLEPDIVVVGDIHVFVGERVAKLRGIPLQLTRLEFDLLTFLARRQGQVVSRRELTYNVWNHGPYQRNTVDRCISNLKRRLGDRPVVPNYIKVIHGVGVMLKDLP